MADHCCNSRQTGAGGRGWCRGSDGGARVERADARANGPVDEHRVNTYAIHTYTYVAAWCSLGVSGLTDCFYQWWNKLGLLRNARQWHGHSTATKLGLLPHDIAGGRESGENTANPHPPLGFQGDLWQIARVFS